MQLHPAPFLVVNPKSSLYGEGSLVCGTTLSFLANHVVEHKGFS